jgi:hypothetical protein
MAQVFVWVGPDLGDYQPGDVIDILEDGVHPGKLVVNGAWDGDCVMPNVVCLDLPDVPRALRIAALAALGVPYNADQLQTLNGILKVAIASLPALVRNRLNNRKRAAVTLLQLAPTISRAPRASDEWIRTRHIAEARGN